MNVLGCTKLRVIAVISSLLASAAVGAASPTSNLRLEEATISELQAAMAAGRLTSERLTKFYQQRIRDLDQQGPAIKSVLVLNPDALAQARDSDARRRRGQSLGTLDGIPVLLKDNIDTGDRMQTTAGSLALVGAPASRDATVVEKLRAAGAVILGKTNLSEWANFRSSSSSSGWSAVGRQTRNPYALNRNPCGSSSGSAAAVTAGFTAIALGTETDGSIVCPSATNGIVGIKPTVGVTSRAGVVPISHTQDTVGTHARTVADAAIALSIIQSLSPDPRDAATSSVPLGWQGKTRPAELPRDYTQFLNADGLRGARLGVTRSKIAEAPAAIRDAFEQTLETLRKAGAVVVDLDAAGFKFPEAEGEFLVLCYEFRDDLRAYLSTRTRVPLAGKSLAELIEFNKAHAALEMPFFAQEIFEMTAAMAPGPDDPQTAFKSSTYRQAIENGRLVGVNGIDKALQDFNLDAIVAPTTSAPWVTEPIYGDRYVFGSSDLAAAPGYPVVQVPAAMVQGLPVGVSFFGTAFSEPTLIRIASGFEAVTGIRAKHPPTFASELPKP